MKLSTILAGVAVVATAIGGAAYYFSMEEKDGVVDVADDVVDAAKEVPGERVD